MVNLSHRLFILWIGKHANLGQKSQLIDNLPMSCDSPIAEIIDSYPRKIDLLPSCWYFSKVSFMGPG